MFSQIHDIAPTAEALAIIGKLLCVEFFEAVFCIEFAVDFGIGVETEGFAAVFL